LNNDGDSSANAQPNGDDQKKLETDDIDKLDIPDFNQSGEEDLSKDVLELKDEPNYQVKPNSAVEPVPKSKELESKNEPESKDEEIFEQRM